MSAESAAVLRRRAIELFLAAFCLLLCWQAVNWAFGPGLFFYNDEIGNLPAIVHAPYSVILHIFPRRAYNDRPLGFACERLLLDLFGLHYAPQVAAFLAIHFANCIMVFLLFRRLGIVTPLSIAAVAVFGSLCTTAQTVTYIGAAFDVICLFFLLASALALLSDRRGSAIASAVFFLLALRSKEFAITAPVLFTVLLAAKSGALSAKNLAAIGRRLWLHYFIAIVFLVRYAALIPFMRAQVPPGDPYYMVVNARTALQSIAYYAALIFGAEARVSSAPPVLITLIAAALAAALAAGLARRQPALAFGSAGFLLTLLPVSFLPHIRSPFYVYAPQVFLILSLCAILQQALLRLFRLERSQWRAAALAAAAVMLYQAWFRRIDYVVNRVNFTCLVRAIGMNTAASVAAYLPNVPDGARVYIAHGSETPWLLQVGDCAYLKVATGSHPAACIAHQPDNELWDLYLRDTAPKVFLDYAPGGSFTVRQSQP